MADNMTYGGHISNVIQSIDVPKKTPPPSNKATVKKMIVADPGLLLEIQFESDSEVKKIELTYKLTLESGDELLVLDWIIDGHDKELDISETYHVILPFVDRDFDGGLENANYTVGVTYHFLSGDPSTFDREDALSIEGANGDALDPNHHMVRKPEVINVNTVKESEGGADIFFKGVYQLAGSGLSGYFKYPANSDSSIESRLENGNVKSTFKFFDPDQGIPCRLIYLPYPRLKDSSVNNDPKDYKLVIEDPNDSSKSISYMFDTSKELYDENIEIQLRSNVQYPDPKYCS